MSSDIDFPRFIAELFEETSTASPCQEKFDAICKQNWKIPTKYLEGLEEDAIPFTIKSKPYLNIRKRLRQQSDPQAYPRRKLNRLAYKAYLLFGNQEQLEAYADRCRQASGDSLSSAEWMHRLAPKFPEPERWSQIRFREWGRVLIQFGYERIQNYFGTLDGPLYDLGGNISLRRMDFTVATSPWKSWVPESDLKPLIDLALRFNKKKKEFERVLKNSFRYADDDDIAPSLAESLPDFTIDGAKFGMPGAVFKKMDRLDPRLLYLGDFTNCCEKISDQENSLERTVVQACMTDYNAYYIVERDSDILAHSWAWRGKSAEMVFDGFESFEHKFNAKNLTHLLDAITLEMLDDRHAALGLNGLYLGTCAKHLTDGKSPYKIPVEEIMPKRIKGVGLTHEQFDVIYPPISLNMTFDTRGDVCTVTYNTIEPT